MHGERFGLLDCYGNEQPGSYEISRKHLPVSGL